MSSIDDLMDVFCRIRRPEEMRQFFDEIFTSAERHDLALRWELMQMLHEGLPQRDIAAQLGISLCKITRGAKILKQRNSISRKMLSSR
ncbi:MAG: transcriptional regulator [Phycisphaerae bacterium]|nr:transcriptional regulator [Phycisphaerae bacterium]